MKNILSQILLSIFLCTYSQAILPISSQATILIKDTEMNTETETIKTKFSEKLKFLIAQNNRLSCKKNSRYIITSNGKQYYYNLRMSIGRVIQEDMTESECKDAVRQLATNNLACVKNRRYVGRYAVVSFFNLISTRRVIRYNMTQLSCIKAIDEL